MSKISDERLADLMVHMGEDQFMGINRTQVIYVHEMRSILTELQSLRSGGEEKDGVGVGLIDSMSDEEFNRDRSDENPNVGKADNIVDAGKMVKPLPGDIEKIISNLRSDAAQLLRMAEVTTFGKDMSVRVKDPSLIIASLVSAADALTNTEPSLRAENERLRKDLNAMQADLDHVSAAIGSVRWMDPPDGGSVSLGEQVNRMRIDLEAAEAKLDEAVITDEMVERAVERLVSASEWQDWEWEEVRGYMRAVLTAFLSNLKEAE